MPPLKKSAFASLKLTGGTEFRGRTKGSFLSEVWLLKDETGFLLAVIYDRKIADLFSEAIEDANALSR